MTERKAIVSPSIHTTSGLAALVIILGSVPALAGPAQVRRDILFRAGVSSYRDSGEFYQGEPVFISVGIRRLKMEANDIPPERTVPIGTPEIPWYRHVSIQLYRIEKAPATEGAQGPQAPADRPFKKVWLPDVRVGLSGSQPRKHELRVNEAARSSWCIDPVTTGKLRPGRYVIQANFDTIEKEEADRHIFHVRRQSHEIVIVVNEPQGSHAKADVLSAQAKYLMIHRQYDDEIKLLKQVLELDPARKGIHCRLGRAYELKGNIDTAIKEYRTYVQWVRSLNLARTGKDDLNDHADVIEQGAKILEETRGKKKTTHE